MEAARSAIDALYQPTDKVITGGRDPIIRIIEYFIDQYIKNYDALGGDNSPRNNALMRSLYGYFQRFAPINFMQAFAQGIYYIVRDKQPLIRSFEYSNWPGHAILPLDSDPLFRLGNEYFAGAGRRWGDAWLLGLAAGVLQNFFQSKTAALQTHTYAATNPKR